MRNLLYFFFVAVAVLAPPGTNAAPAQEKPQASQAEPIDFMRARALMRKKQQGEKLTADEEAYLQKAIAARRGQAGPRPGAAEAKEKTGFKPLTEMSAEDRYKGQDGGLYGGGSNTPPDAHRQAALAAAARIQPLDADGKPAADGRIVLVSISMSNATQEFSKFKNIADADPAKS
jgi:hypothetical protein